MKKILEIFIIGAAILIAALILNVFAQKLSITTWYDFADNPTDTSLLAYLWLFFVYPFLLGLTAYIVSKRLS
jgi:hypothetical protein